MIQAHSTLFTKPMARFPFPKINRLLILGILLTMFMGGSYGIDGPIGQQSDINQAFGITDGEVVSLELDRTPGQSVLAEITIDSDDYTLDLQPNSIRADHFVLMVQLPDGSYEDGQPGVSRTLKGELQGIKGSRVVGSMLESGLAAQITLGDGRVFFVEPLADRMAGNNLEKLHVVYRKSDFAPHDGVCGLDDNAVGKLGDIHNGKLGDIHNANGIQTRPRRKHQNEYPEGGAPDVQVAELAVDADFEYFSVYGTVQNTLNRMELIVNIVNDQYETDVALTHVISAAIVRSAEPDPYSSTDSLILLTQFRNQWLNNHAVLPRDVAHLFTGKDINGGVIGRAWDIGAICNDDAYCMSQSDFNNQLGCATDLTAHELGHLWNGSHCSCSSHTMNPFITCANDFHPTFTIPNIVAYRNTLDCLDNGGVTPPPNDDFANTFLIADPDFAVTGTNVDATTQADEQQLANTGSTVWWFFDANTDGTVTIDTFGSNFDTQLHIFTGFELGFPNLIPVINNDDTGGLQSQVKFAVTAGQCYEIRVGGFRNTGNTGPGSEGDIVLNGVFQTSSCTNPVGDLNGDGLVNLLDVAPFVAALQGGIFECEADINGDGAVNLLDIGPFIALISGS